MKGRQAPDRRSSCSGQKQEPTGTALKESEFLSWPTYLMEQYKRSGTFNQYFFIRLLKLERKYTARVGVFLFLDFIMGM